MELHNEPSPVSGGVAALATSWKRRRFFCQLLTALMWLSVVGVLLSFSMRDRIPYKNEFLMLGTFCYLAVAVLGGAWRWTYGRLVLLGLICCALGDYLGLRNFVWGALAFLVAHIFFVAAFCVVGIDWRRALRFVPIMIVVGVGILAWLSPGMAAEDVPLVLGYLVVISLMVILAYGISSQHQRPLILLAAIVFYVSDIFVARWRFTDSGSINGYFCYPMYYTACVMFAWTACMYYQHRTPVDSRSA